MFFRMTQNIEPYDGRIGRDCQRGNVLDFYYY
jgi:hypothetical protein